MKDLDKDYQADACQVEAQSWYNIMHKFEDANLYQTSAYDGIGSGNESYSHLILRRENEIVAAAQTRIIQLPVIKKGIAYVMWGPMWRRVFKPDDVEVFRQAIRALRNEFSLRRGLVLRVYPLAFRGKDDVLKQILVDEGFSFHDDEKSHRTLMINIEPSLAEIRAALDQKWRNCLNRAEKNGLEIIQGEEESLFDEITKIYLEMANRKGLADLSDIEHLKKVQRDLPPGLKLKVILCFLNGEICSGSIFSAIGATAVYLIGATSNAGMKSNSSYLVQWAFMEWIKEKGLLYYDLNGINPVTNPGTYHFKRGLAGKKGIDIEFLGKYQIADNPMSALIVNGGELLVSRYKKILKKGRSLRNSSNKNITAK
jgi:lipid II:glycine glycyltransferase (peptidoglycan interpeptide bridge formation enzyme)